MSKVHVSRVSGEIKIKKLSKPIKEKNNKINYIKIRISIPSKIIKIKMYIHKTEYYTAIK